jgi:hypothetical protein
MVIFIDDILIDSDIDKDYEQDIHFVIKTLQKYNLKLNNQQSILGIIENKVSSYRVDYKEVRLLKYKISSIIN